MNELYPKLSTAKVNEGVFIGPDISKIMKSEEFKSALSQTELTPWLSIIKIKENFLGKHRATNYEEIIVMG